MYTAKKRGHGSIDISLLQEAEKPIFEDNAGPGHTNEEPKETPPT